MARRFIAPLVATSLVLLSLPAAEAANTPDFGMLADTVCTKVNQEVDD